MPLATSPRASLASCNGGVPSRRQLLAIAAGGIATLVGARSARTQTTMSPTATLAQLVDGNDRTTLAQKEGLVMSGEDNKAIVGRWFTEFWGKTCNLGVIDELAAPDMLLQYSLHAPRRGRKDIKAFMSGFREAFPDLNFWGTADLIAEGNHVVGRWEGGGTHTGPAFSDFLVGSLPAATGRKMHFTGITVLRVEKGKIVEEKGLDDGVTALTQLGLLRAV